MRFSFSSFLKGLAAAAGLALFVYSVGNLISPVIVGDSAVVRGGRELWPTEREWENEGDSAEESARIEALMESKAKADLAAENQGLAETEDLVIVLDPGHGGSDPGSVREGHYEKDINLAVAKRVRKKLESAGQRVVMTRNGDETLDLQSRVAVANRFRRAIFVSIHQNASLEKGPRGVETYFALPRPASVLKAQRERYGIPAEYRHEDGRASLLATRVQDAFCKNTKAPSRGTKNRNFVVIRWVHGPAVLVECGFLSNAEERKRLLSDDYRDKIAGGIASGILAYVEESGGDMLYGLEFPDGAPTGKSPPARRTVVQALPGDS